MSAVFSPCRTWRYTLTRLTEHAVAALACAPGCRADMDAGLHEPECKTSFSTVAFIGLNPSTADEVVNDATVRRCIGYATRWRFERMVMLNVFAYRARNPRRLREVALADAVGPDNDRHLMRGALDADLVVCCWGVHGALGDRGEAVRARLDARMPLHVLGVTKDDFPKHPLYLRGDLEPVPWDG